jgi:hypothetical protein
MKQMDLPDNMKVKIDFSDQSVPASVKVLKPLLFVDGNSYCCVLGEDPQAGVFGCGVTAHEALQDWDNHLKERIASRENDELTPYIKNTLEKAANEVKGPLRGEIMKYLESK